MVKIRRKDKTFFQFITPNAPPSGGKRREMAGNGKYNFDITLN